MSFTFAVRYHIVQRTSSPIAINRYHLPRSSFATWSFIQPKKPIVEWTFKEQQKQDGEFEEKSVELTGDDDDDDEVPSTKRRLQMNHRRFTDKLRVQVKAGNGGAGCVSFFRDSRVSRGPPNGGNGGRGGDVIVKATLNENNFNNVNTFHFRAQSGRHGQGKDRNGGKGEDCIIQVPVGTVVKDITDPEKSVPICDLDKPEASVVVAEGGFGGKGNRNFMSSTNRSPKQHTTGQPGEEKRVLLELKLIADVGLVGYPNAGKSTFLCAISEAHPRVASYPFTTLHPTVGVVRFDDFYSLSVADLPGLIEGAHKNVGLGHQFLRHVERTKLICYVIDMAGNDGRKPWDDFLSLQNELELYQQGLSSRKGLILANKLDLQKFRSNFVKFATQFSHLGMPIFPICAKKRIGLRPVMNFIRSQLEEHEAELKEEKPSSFRKTLLKQPPRK